MVASVSSCAQCTMASAIACSVAVLTSTGRACALRLAATLAVRVGALRRALFMLRAALYVLHAMALAELSSNSKAGFHACIELQASLQLGLSLQAMASVGRLW